MSEIVWGGHFPAALMNMNDPLPSTKWARSKRREQGRLWRNAAWAAVCAKPRPKVAAKATLTVEFGTDRPNQRRDPHNFMPTVKHLIDGIVDAGVLIDDSHRQLATTEPIFTAALPPRTFRMTLRWEEADG